MRKRVDDIYTGDNTEQEKKSAREALISAYVKNISTRLKTELCSSDANNYSHTKDVSTNCNGPLCGILGLYHLYNAVFTFHQERRMLIKERSSGMYRLSSYFLAKTVGDLPLELALPTAFTFILYWMGGLKVNPATFILSLLVVLYSVVISQSLGLAYGALIMDVKQATTLASVTTLVFIIDGGYYIQQIPPFIVWLKYLSYRYYCYKLLLGVQYNDNDYYECSKGV
ncbi:putative conserved oligomeric Golgi complex subunit 6-like [Capsicum annuum]|nr:putative conserved oligomeric Golgi complex subunit 6-like [Capsicum annuum]